MSTDNNKLKNADSKQNSRRKIVKGLAGLPAMVTLASGAANAATSSQCIVDNAENLRNNALPPENALVLNTENTSTDSTITKDCLPDTDVTAAGAPGGTTLYESAPGHPAREILNAPGEPGDTQACVIFVDENGQFQGYNTGDGHPVTTSCYTSFVVSP